jgi:hypothetical protein
MPDTPSLSQLMEPPPGRFKPVVSSWSGSDTEPVYGSLAMTVAVRGGTSAGWCGGRPDSFQGIVAWLYNMTDKPGSRQC